MKTLIRAVTLIVLLAGIAGPAVAQRARVRIDVGRPWVRGHVGIGPRYSYRYYNRPYVVRPYMRQYYRRPFIVAPRAHLRRPFIMRRPLHQRSHLRWF